MSTKNEVVEVNATSVASPAMLSAVEFKTAMQGAIGVSPLAYGDKFESDELVKADNVHLTAFDYVEYQKNAGKADEENVRYTVWRVTLTEKGKEREGYYAAGVVLTRLADYITNNGLCGELETYGIDVRAEWSKTSDKNDIMTFTII